MLSRALIAEWVRIVDSVGFFIRLLASVEYRTNVACNSGLRLERAFSGGELEAQIELYMRDW